MIPRATVLVVDDDPDTCDLLRFLVEMQGHDVRAATSGAAALQRLSGEPVDAVLLDVRLPDVSGLDLLARIKTASPLTEVICVTGHASLSTAMQAMNGSAFSYLVKPIDPEQLLLTLTRALEKGRLERALRESEARYRLVTDSILDAVFFTDLDGRLLLVNRRAAELTDRAMEALRGAPIVELVMPETAAEIRARLDAVRAGAPMASTFEGRLVGGDGRRRWIEVNVASVVDGPAVVGAIAVVRDIDERKRAEADYRELIEHSIEGILVHRGFRIELANPAAARMFGYDRAAELVGTDLRTLIAPEEVGRLEDYAGARLRGESAPARYEFAAVRRDGSPMWVETLATLVEWRGEPAILATLLDLTEHKRLEDQLRQAAKMEAIGRLAGGVAHDFNNILTIIAGRTQLLLMQPALAEPLRQELDLIDQAAQRAAMLTGQLLAFSRRQVIEPVALDVSVVVRNLEPIIRRLVGEHIDVVVKLAARGRVKADAVQLEQVVMNLVVNARDAMPDGGQVTVETADAGPGVRLAITDTGCGMTADVLAHVFEPFFTTKRTGEGTGLGLATVYGIVTQSDGTITVASAPGRGTTFTIHLPRVGDATPAPAAPTVEAPPARGAETILLVEDEPRVRDFAREVLEGYGYTVLPAANADHADRVAAGHAGPIHLLVSDVIMPGASGPELAERLGAARPSLKVLFVSGYTADAVLRRGVREQSPHFLSKPFSPQALGRKVREVLDGG